MANNRMVLICNVCIPEIGKWEYDQEGVLVIAKWYPAGGFIGGEDGSYYRNDNGKHFGKEFLDFLYKHQHKGIASEYYSKGAGQENPIRLEYESVGLPILPSQKDFNFPGEDDVAELKRKDINLIVIGRNLFKKGNNG